MDIDKQIAETEEKIEKLKILKAKQDELKKLQSEVAVTDDIAIETKPSQEKKIHKLKLSSNYRKVAVCFLVFSIVLAISFVFVPRVTAADPAIVTASPGNGTFFASTNNGSGVSWAVNVSDGDNDIAEVELWGNSSGSWVLFYDSGALGGVAYHDTSGQNGNWTGSWTKYWWNISAKDGVGWTNATYSFTTSYQWGDPQMAIFDDDKVYDSGVVYKNNTGDYYLWANNATNQMIVVKTSDTGTNWSLEPIDAGIAATGGTPSGFPTGAFTYNNQPSFMYTFYFSASYHRYFAYFDGSSWNTADVGISQGSSFDGGDVIYYDGQWQMMSTFYSGVSYYLMHYYGTPYTTWTQGTSLDIVSGASWPSLAILDGIMYCVYRDTEYDLHWQTYNGAAWTDQGDIEVAIQAGEGGCSMVKDPVNQQLVSVYVDSSGDLKYRVTDNLTGWSKNDTIFSKGDYTIQYPYVDYIDHRLVISFGYTLRGNYNIYTMSSPDYSGRISGLNYTLNRIQWPDTNPDDTYVNSTIFNLRNINNRSIKTITWHFEDIGEITCASNIEVWTNMSGAWTSIGVCDASGDVATLDISSLIPGSGEWIPGNYTWWKVEILAIGSCSEDLHSTDEDIYYKITF